MQILLIRHGRPETGTAIPIPSSAKSGRAQARSARGLPVALRRRLDSLEPVAPRPADRGADRPSGSGSTCASIEGLAEADRFGGELPLRRRAASRSRGLAEFSRRPDRLISAPIRSRSNARCSTRSNSVLDGRRSEGGGLHAWPADQCGAVARAGTREGHAFRAALLLDLAVERRFARPI